MRETARLTEILDGMDVPEARKKDLGWLRRNLAVRNGGHPDCGEALGLIRFISNAEFTQFCDMRHDDGSNPKERHVH